MGVNPWTMRIGTWNLAGRVWLPAHRELLTVQDCDVWLLTEVRADVDLPGYQAHLTAGEMAPRPTLGRSVLPIRAHGAARPAYRERGWRRRRRDVLQHDPAVALLRPRPVG